MHPSVLNCFQCVNIKDFIVCYTLFIWYLSLFERGNMKNKSLPYIHITVWLLGTAFLVTGAFHENLWFDESYTVGLMNHNFFEMIRISAADVHPPFYYILLKLFTLVFGNNLVTMRLFSVLFASLLAGLGFTHLRKDFGEKMGFWYTTLMFLFAVTFKYASEIRMYTLAPFLVMLMCIYAYRFYKSGLTDKKSKVLFIVFAILSAYTHYYALAAAGAVNFLLLIYCNRNKLLKSWIILAAIQLLAYSAGIFILIQQYLTIKEGFWISMIYPDIFFQTISFFLLGDAPADAAGVTAESLKMYFRIFILFWTMVVIFGYKYRKKNPSQFEPARLSLHIIELVIAFFFAVSLLCPFYYVRYLLALWGPIVFIFALLITKLENRVAKTLLLLFLSVLLVVRVIPNYHDIYSEKSIELESFFKDNIKEGDIVLSENFELITISSVRHTDIDMIFYNSKNWSVENAYEAFEPYMKTVRDISGTVNKNCRIWIIDASESLCTYIAENSEKEVVATYDSINIPYHDMQYKFTLME